MILASFPADDHLLCFAGISTQTNISTKQTFQHKQTKQKIAIELVMLNNKRARRKYNTYIICPIAIHFNWTFVLNGVFVIYINDLEDDISSKV